MMWWYDLSEKWKTKSEKWVFDDVMIWW